MRMGLQCGRWLSMLQKEFGLHHAVSCAASFIRSAVVNKEASSKFLSSAGCGE